jgi:hypothetical protein
LNKRNIKSSQCESELAQFSYPVDEHYAPDIEEDVKPQLMDLVEDKSSHIALSDPADTTGTSDPLRSVEESFQITPITHVVEVKTELVEIIAEPLSHDEFFAHSSHLGNSAVEPEEVSSEEELTASRGADSRPADDEFNQSYASIDMTSCDEGNSVMPVVKLEPPESVVEISDSCTSASSSSHDQRFLCSTSGTCDEVNSTPPVVKHEPPESQVDIISVSSTASSETDKPFVCSRCGLPWKYKSLLIQHVSYSTFIASHHV